MSFVRSVPARSLRQLRTLCAPRQSFLAQQAQRAGRRGYASATDTLKKGTDAAKHAVSSDMPWLITSVLVTVPGTYLILSSGGGGGHDGGHGEHGAKHDAHEEEEEHPAEEEEKPEGEEEKSDEKAEEGAAEKSDEGDSEKGEEDKKDEEPKVEDESSDGKTILKDDAKGGVKRRVESPNAQKLGESEDSEGDAAAPSKEPVEGSTSGKQAGLSNTDTKHSTNIDEDPEKSKKPEGGPDTAKAQGTVEPSRPAS